MSSTETLLQIIKDSPLSETTKAFFEKKVQKEGATQENIIALRELLRAVKHQVAADAGIQVDPNDPAIKAAEAEMKKDLKAAADQYAATMQRLEQQAVRLNSDIKEDLESIEKIVVDAAKAEA